MGDHPPLKPRNRFRTGLAVLVGLVSGGLFLTLTSQQTPAAGTTPPPSQIKPLVADLSKHIVAITTGFSGTDVLMFGATDGPGDVVLVVRGPSETQVVRRQDKLAGVIWANAASMTFDDVPNFFQVTSTRPVEEILSPAARLRHRIMPDSLDLVPRTAITTSDAEQEQFRTALLRLKERQGLYSYQPQAISQLANRLFRADLFFPSNVPTGAYTAEVYLVRDGDIVSAEITPLVISKVGFSAEVFLFAYKHSALYGLAAIVVAVAAGWVAGVAFRKS